MSRIILARHGRPVLDSRTWISGNELGAWLEAEREAPLDPASRPSAELEQLARAARLVIVSPLRRSRDSAQRLRPAIEPTIEEVVREAPLPSAFRSSLRLPPAVWAAIARSAWFCGWSPGVERFSEVRRRAAAAARRLQALATDRGDVLVVGHGLMNTLIAAELRALGWRGARFPSRSHWQFGRYED
jgi:broad specificity phosphatase PhoE